MHSSCKRLLVFLISSALCAIASADENFDITRNYQGNDASVYMGEILDVNNPPEGVDSYRLFKAYPFNIYDNDDRSELFIPTDYHGWEDGFTEAGTEVKWLRGKSFQVFSVQHFVGSEYPKKKWVLHLRNLADDNDCVSFVYYGDPDLLDLQEGEFKNFILFPFTCRKYKEYQVRLEEEREAARLAEEEAKRIADSIQNAIEAQVSALLAEGELAEYAQDEDDTEESNSMLWILLFVLVLGGVVFVLWRRKIAQQQEAKTKHKSVDNLIDSQIIKYTMGFFDKLSSIIGLGAHTTSEIIGAHTQSEIGFDLDDGNKTLIITGQGEIPDNWDGWPHNASYKKLIIEDGITSIGDMAFFHIDVDEILIGKGVKRIGKHAFANTASRIKRLVISENVEEIGAWAFCRVDHVICKCQTPPKAAENAVNEVKKILSMEVPSGSLKYYVVAPCWKKIEISRYKEYKIEEENSSKPIAKDDAKRKATETVHRETELEENSKHEEGKIDFEYDIQSEILTINGTGAIPDEWEGWPHNASYKKLIIEDGITSIGAHAFKGVCAKNIIIKNSVTTIRDHAFEGAKANEVIIGDGVITIGKRAFYLTNLNSVIIGNGVTTIEEEAFSSIKKVVFGNHIKVIKRGAFYSYEQRDLILPESVEIIEENAFYNCLAHDIVLPMNIKKIGEYAFRTSDRQSINIICKCPIPPQIFPNSFAWEHYDKEEKHWSRGGIVDSICTVTIPPGSLKNYLKAHLWKTINLSCYREKSEEEILADKERKAELEKKRLEEAAQKFAAEEAARKKAKEEAARKKVEEAKRKAEEEARKKAEAEAEAKRKAEEEARKKAEEEARKKAKEEAARKKAEEEARKKAEVEAARKMAEKSMDYEINLDKKMLAIKGGPVIPDNWHPWPDTLEVRKVVILNGITSIGKGIFENLQIDKKVGCDIFIPESVTSIGESAFKMSTSDTRQRITIYSCATKAPKMGQDALRTSKIDGVIIPKGSLKSYIEAPEWRDIVVNKYSDIDKELIGKTEFQEAEYEFNRLVIEAAHKKAEEEARKKAEEEAKRKAEAESRKKAEAEAKRKAEEESRKKAEAEAEAKRKAEEAARKKAEEAESKRKAELYAKLKAEMMADEEYKEKLIAEEKKKLKTQK